LFIFPKQLEKSDEIDTTKSSTSEKEKPEHRMEGVHLVESPQGSRDWELFATKARGVQGEGDWFLNQVRVQFYNKNKIEFIVTANEGEIDGKTRNIKFKGSVVTKSNNGYTFYTEELFYQAGQRKILSPGKLKMLGPSDDQGDGLLLDGYNMLAEVDTSEMRIFKDVKATKKLKNQNELKIKSEMAQFNGQNKEAHFENNVVLNIQEMKIEGPDCYFIYSPNMNVLEFIRFKGGVVVQDKKRKAVSQLLEVNLFANTFRFQGDPKIYQDDDEIKGEEILFIDGGKKIKIQKVNASGKF
ncbi:MAG: LPS export ABC transporter periplasmic protein LptC, partial [Bdellovibrionaceae bacterium]|nr:LPS export ABC transporter periplasmic protein LptC [Pseudobdellovibrionaceae bacterium]